MPYRWQRLSCVPKTHHLSEAQLGFNSRLLNPPTPPPWGHLAGQVGSRLRARQGHRAEAKARGTLVLK